MSEQEKKIEGPNEIVDIAEMILQFNRQNCFQNKNRLQIRTVDS